MVRYKDMIIKTYEELITLPTFEERFLYLTCKSLVGDFVHPMYRSYMQSFYTSKEWASTRARIITRDNGLDLGVCGHDIVGPITLHHINCITVDDLRNRSYKLLSASNLICVSSETHKAIHYGDLRSASKPITDRTKDDTTLWRQ